MQSVTKRTRWTLTERNLSKWNRVEVACRAGEAVQRRCGVGQSLLKS
jgi:hypothetical protein